MSTIARIRETIAAHDLPDWLDEFRWLTGYLGDPQSRVWFVGEYPSRAAVERIHRRELAKPKNLQWNCPENLQWNCNASDRLFREALTEADLKTGDPFANSGWRCYLTNAVKSPDIVKDRNTRNSAANMRDEARIWLPVFQDQLDSGAPAVLVALGEKSEKLLGYMSEYGLRHPPEMIKIDAPSYVMFRPDKRTGLGPRAPARIAHFKECIFKIARRYGS